MLGEVNRRWGQVVRSAWSLGADGLVGCEVRPSWATFSEGWHFFRGLMGPGSGE